MPCLMTKQHSDIRDGSIAQSDSELIHPGDFDNVASFEALAVHRSNHSDFDPTFPA